MDILVLSLPFYLPLLSDLPSSPVFGFVVYETTVCFGFPEDVCFLGGSVSHLGRAKAPLYGLGTSTKEMSFPRLSIHDHLRSLV